MLTTNGLTRLLRHEIRQLRSSHPRARARIIEECEIADIASAARRAARQMKGNDSWIHVRVRGGYMPNSAKFSGESDRVDILIDETGIEVSAKRGPSEKRAYGSGPWITVHTGAADQTQGRLVVRC
tara:strand:- start:1112 stop:1489 length:378 start_codon:yes stop_codon:yes gene_type:complete